MFSKYIIALCLTFFVVVINCQPPSCGENQVFRTCGSACPETCEPNPLRICTANCVVGCHCQDDHVLSRSGRCIHRSQCPQ
uniref:Cysteine-rich venom protein 6-like n=1 Tax=Habrobracon hebetor TaxID=69819 RepID=A0A455LAT6_9HYME|nr:cysteine-rich venom protein 6-like [Habrobracon hebetor]